MIQGYMNVLLSQNIGTIQSTLSRCYMSMFGVLYLYYYIIINYDMNPVHCVNLITYFSHLDYCQ